MARDKTDKTDKTPVATTAIRKDEVESRKPLVGLLGDELDLFAAVGLGHGASDRAKSLVLKGLESELSELRRQLKPTRGRPRKEFPNIDIERAAAVLGAADLWRDEMGEGPPTQKAAIELAIQIDTILVKAAVRSAPLFGGEMTTFPRLQNSVSKGLANLGETRRFSKK
jgi:hypothetical protein